MRSIDDKEKFRYWVLHVGFLANFIGFVLTLYACLAISEDYGTLRNVAFSSGVLNEVDNKIDTITLDIGLKAVALNNPATVGEVMLSFDQLCDLSLESDRLGRYLDTSNCDGCEKVSKSMVSTVIVSVITFVPSLTTDILRMYSNYDVNCQKVFATVFAAISLLLSLNTLLQYNRACFSIFYEGLVTYNSTGSVVDPDSSSVAYTLLFDWGIGKGLACLYAGTVLKGVDIVCNIMVATPTITRDAKEQAEYEKIPRDDDIKEEGGSEEVGGEDKEDEGQA
jgi:hypothetical protein